MGPLPTIHPREAIVTQAERDMGAAIDKVIGQHGLTTGEAIRVVNGAFASWLGSLARSWIRQERHGDADKPGGWA